MERQICQRPPKTEKTFNNHRTASKATTTPLVHDIFESIFAADGVLADAKGNSADAKNKVAIKKESDEEEEEDDGDEEDPEKFAQNTQRRRRELSKEEKKERGRRNARGFEGEWIGSVLETVGKKDFYAGVRIEGQSYAVGDHVLIKGKRCYVVFIRVVVQLDGIQAATRSFSYLCLSSQVETFEPRLTWDSSLLFGRIPTERCGCTRIGWSVLPRRFLRKLVILMNCSSSTTAKTSSSAILFAR